MAISSSTRSSELSPSDSIGVSGPMSPRPGAKRCTAARTLPVRRSAAPADGVAASPSTQRFTSRRFSLRVPSVRGSSAPGQRETLRIFW
jgi:hypothetical protein